MTLVGLQPLQPRRGVKDMTKKQRANRGIHLLSAQLELRPPPPPSPPVSRRLLLSRSPRSHVLDPRVHPAGDAFQERVQMVVLKRGQKDVKDHKREGFCSRS